MGEIITTLKLPLPRKCWLAIVDRDATIISSSEIAYGCYEAAFAAVISKVIAGPAKLTAEEYTREFNPFDRLGVYRKFYPQLTEEGMKAVGEVSWQFYLDHYSDEKYNRLLPGMDGFLRAFKAAGNSIAILTVSESAGIWLERHGVPFDGFFGMRRLKNEGRIEGRKEEAITFILKDFDWPAEEAVTIGDNPEDHRRGIISIGAGFGLGNADARAALENAVDIYAPDVDSLYRVFGLDSGNTVSR